MNFIEELKWRGLFHQDIPGTEEYLLNNPGTRGYIGFDPTMPSLGIGNMVQIIILKHFQRAGHQPIAVLGGATGMVGDPSGKSAERNLLDGNQLEINKQNVEAQLRQFLDFDCADNPAILVDNYDFYKDMNVLTFLRDVGKHLTVNYMMAKDSVKSRLETGISYTEFTYQLLQGYDFYKLFQEYDCKLQLGGSDQWGNLTTGVELVRRMGGGEVYAATSPLVTKADGTKFGKTEKGNVFLSAELTSPYAFYQFWLNVSDEDAENFIKIFTFLEREVIESLIAEHKEAPHQRLLQKRLAEEVTVMVHSRGIYEEIKEASRILFYGSLDEIYAKANLLNHLERDIATQYVSNEFIKSADNGISVVDLLGMYTNVFNSKQEVRRAIKQNALSINNTKVTSLDFLVTAKDFNESFLLVGLSKRDRALVKSIEYSLLQKKFIDIVRSYDQDFRDRLEADQQLQRLGLLLKQEDIFKLACSGERNERIAAAIAAYGHLKYYSEDIVDNSFEVYKDALQYLVHDDNSSFVRYRAIMAIMLNEKLIDFLRGRLVSLEKEEGNNAVRELLSKNMSKIKGV